MRIFFFAAGLVSSAAVADVHEIFEAQCFSRHGHAGEFAHRSMAEIDGVLTGVRLRQEVAALLPRHAGGLNPSEIAFFVDVITYQLNSGSFHQDRCEFCHDRDYELAYLRLILRDGRLVGRYSGRAIASFLPGHALITAEEAGRILGALTALRISAC
jgi:hypothetical protein